MASFWDLLPAALARQPSVTPDPDEVDPWSRPVFPPVTPQADAGSNAAPAFAAAANQLGGVLGATFAAQPLGILGPLFPPLAPAPNLVDAWLRPFSAPMPPLVGADSNAAPPFAASTGQLGGALGTAAATQPTASLWDPLPAHAQPFPPLGPTPDQVDPWLRPFGPPMAPRGQLFLPPGSTPDQVDPWLRPFARPGAPAAADQEPDLGAAYGNPNIARQGARAREIAAMHPPPDPRLLAIASAAVRPLTDYFPTQGQYAREGLDLMKQGWQDATSQPFLPSNLGEFGSRERMERPMRGPGEMLLGAVNYLGSPINAALHTLVGQPVEDATGIPSRYTDFAAGLALPFLKRLPGTGARPFGAVASGGDSTAGMTSPLGAGPAALPETDLVASPPLAGWSDIDEFRARYNVPNIDTVAIARTDIPGLEKLEGASPLVRDRAGLPRAVPGPIRSQAKLPRDRDHAEEDIANQFVRGVEQRGMSPSDLDGRTLTIRVSQSPCPTCRSGLDSGAPAGVLKQLSDRYPGLTIVVESEFELDPVTRGIESFAIKGGRYIRRSK